MQKHVNLVDLVKSFPTNIYLQNLASIQKRTSPVKFAHLAEKSGKGSISNLSTKVDTIMSETSTLKTKAENTVAKAEAFLQKATSDYNGLTQSAKSVSEDSGGIRLCWH